MFFCMKRIIISRVNVLWDTKLTTSTVANCTKISLNQVSYDQLINFLFSKFDLIQPFGNENGIGHKPIQPEKEHIS